MEYRPRIEPPDELLRYLPTGTYLLQCVGLACLLWRISRDDVDDALPSGVALDPDWAKLAGFAAAPVPPEVERAAGALTRCGSAAPPLPGVFAARR